mmetsp:Transcript_40370/g.104480  ORF Transcript_40370/g.104480 Transcript_40370/m.104480 type:complete len:156 (-) Transcript_40370:147-614(-)
MRPSRSPTMPRSTSSRPSRPPRTATDVQPPRTAALVSCSCVVKESVEATCATMDAAVAAVTGVMIVEFVPDKGAVRKVSFKTNNVGFEIAMSGGGCCGPAAQARVAVKKVDKKGQAETLGVLKSWKVVSINGTPVTGLDQAQKLLADCAAKLPQA